MTDSIAVGLLEKLQQCSKASEDGDVDLETYINCWSSLNQILGVLGSVFRFVQSDVEDKVQILQRIYNEKKYKSINVMMIEEKANGLINYEFLDEKNPSASRTLLRLHRALKMVALLLQKISSDKKEKMSKIAYDSYHECPMPAHHPWVIKKAIGAAVYTLSDVKSFCNSIAPNMEQAELNAKLIEASDIMDKIFDDTDKLYIEHKLDSIP
jgi:hypothetical protein